MGKRISGAKIIVIDEISLTSLEDFYGATGTVVGFGFHAAIPEENFPTVNTFHTLQKRELPIVFVKLDTYTGTQLSTDVDKQT